MAEKAAPKTCPSTETLKNSNKKVGINSLRILENKDYSNHTNTESRKTQLKNSRKALHHFSLPLTLPLPSSSTVLNMAAHIPSGGPWSLVLERAKQTLS